MPELGTSGSVRGVRSNAHPYRDAAVGCDLILLCQRHPQRQSGGLCRHHRALVERPNRRPDHKAQAGETPDVWTSQNRSAASPADRRSLIPAVHHRRCVRAKFERRLTCWRTEKPSTSRSNSRWQTGLKFEASLPIRAQVDRAPQIAPFGPKAGKPPPKQSKIAKPGQNLASLKFLVKIQNLRMRSDAVKTPSIARLSKGHALAFHSAAVSHHVRARWCYRRRMPELSRALRLMAAAIMIGFHLGKSPSIVGTTRPRKRLKINDVFQHADPGINICHLICAARVEKTRRQDLPPSSKPLSRLRQLFSPSVIFMRAGYNELMV